MTVLPPVILKKSAHQESLGVTGLWLLMVFSFLTAILLKENVASIDLWGKLAIPAIFFQSGTFPLVDDFSFTAEQGNWTDHEWLSGFVFYFALLWGGDAGLSGLKLFCLFLSLAGVFWALRWQGVPAWFTSVLLLTFGTNALITGFLTTGRPQIFTFAFLPWFLDWLWSRLAPQVDLKGLNFIGMKRFWSYFEMGLLGWAWGNLHAGFVVGLGLLVVTSLWCSLQSFLDSKKGFDWQEHLHWAYPLIFVLGVSLNPYGQSYWSYILYAVTVDRMGVSEWAPVDWGNVYFRPSIVLLLLLSGGLLRAIFKQKTGSSSDSLDSSDRLNPTVCHLILFGLIAYFGFRYIKHQPLFILGGLTLAAGYGWVSLRALYEKLSHFKSKMMIVIPVLGVFLALGNILQQEQTDVLRVNLHRIQQVGHRTAPYPVEAIRYLKNVDQNNTARLITPFSWGEYAFWELYPKFKISLDGRLEAVYPMSVFHQHRSLYLNHRISWPKADGYRSSEGPLFLLTETRRQSPKALLPNTWRLCYQDPVYSVFQAINFQAINSQAMDKHAGNQQICSLQVVDAIPESPLSTYPVFLEAIQSRRFKTYPPGSGNNKIEAPEN
jgi:hypothetical protein